MKRASSDKISNAVSVMGWKSSVSLNNPMTPKVQSDQIVPSSITQLTCDRKRYPNEYDYEVTPIPNINSIEN